MAKKSGHSRKKRKVKNSRIQLSIEQQQMVKHNIKESFVKLERIDQNVYLQNRLAYRTSIKQEQERRNAENLLTQEKEQEKLKCNNDKFDEAFLKFENGDEENLVENQSTEILFSTNTISIGNTEINDDGQSGDSDKECEEDEFVLESHLEIVDTKINVQLDPKDTLMFDEFRESIVQDSQNTPEVSTDPMRTPTQTRTSDNENCLTESHKKKKLKAKTKRTDSKNVSSKSKKKREMSNKLKSSDISVESKKVLKCPLCTRIYENQSGFLRHVIMHSIEQRNSCFVCNRVYSSRGKLNEHFRNIHRLKVVERCGCLRVFYNLNEANEHKKKCPRFVFTRIKNQGSENNNKNSENDEESVLESNLEFSKNNDNHSTLKNGKKEEASNGVRRKVKRKRSKENQLEPLEIIVEDKKMLKCPLCDQTFELRSDFVEHKTMHANDRPFPCSRCSRSFTQRNKYSQHMRNEHGMSVIDRCRSCGMGFFSVGEAEEHKTKCVIKLMYQETEHPFLCLRCDKTFNKRDYLVSHMRRTHQMKPIDRCRSCNMRFFSLDEASGHKTQCRGTMKRKTSFSWNNVPGGGNSGISRDRGKAKAIRLANEQRDSVIQGPSSNPVKLTVTTQTPQSRLIEIEKKNKQELDNFNGKTKQKCGNEIIEITKRNEQDSDSCKMKQNCESNLDDKLMLECPLCAKTFESKSGFLKHTTEHSVEKKYSCVRCNKSINDRSEYLKHMRLDHQMAPIHRCHCGQTFYSDKEISDHTNCFRNRTFECVFCKFTCLSSYPLQIHTRSLHTNYKPRCKICKKAFSSMTRLREHRKSRHPELFPFKCAECKKTFSEDYALRKHYPRCRVLKRRRKRAAKKQNQMNTIIVDDKEKTLNNQ